MIATIAKVADFDQFRKTFSTIGVEKRKQHGCRGAYLFRDPDDPSRVWAFFDWMSSFSRGASWSDRATAEVMIDDATGPEIGLRQALGVGDHDAYSLERLGVRQVADL